MINKKTVIPIASVFRDDECTEKEMIKDIKRFIDLILSYGINIYKIKVTTKNGYSEVMISYELDANFAQPRKLGLHLYY